MKKIELRFDPGKPGGKLILDGVDISRFVRSVTVHGADDELPTAEITYQCMEVVVEGQVEVKHVCGAEWR